eukprot:SAG11_NODE_1488_length_4814_cov_5.777943_1_plen_625_part_00
MPSGGFRARAGRPRKKAKTESDAAPLVSAAAGFAKLFGHRQSASAEAPNEQSAAAEVPDQEYLDFEVEARRQVVEHEETETDVPTTSSSSEEEDEGGEEEEVAATTAAAPQSPASSTAIVPFVSGAATASARGEDRSGVLTTAKIAQQMSQVAGSEVKSRFVFLPAWRKRFQWIHFDTPCGDFEAGWQPNKIGCAACLKFPSKALKKDALTTFKVIPGTPNCRVDAFTNHEKRHLQIRANKGAFDNWAAEIVAERAQRHEKVGPAASASRLILPSTSTDTYMCILIRTHLTMVVHEEALGMGNVILKLMRACDFDAPIAYTHSESILEIIDAAYQVVVEDDRRILADAPVHSLMGDGSSDRHHSEQEDIAVRALCVPKLAQRNLCGLHIETFHHDLQPVDVLCSKDKLSYDATAVLSSYTKSMAMQGLASFEGVDLSTVQSQEEAIDKALRAGHKPAIGKSIDCVWPSRTLSTALDGASVNMGCHGGVATLLDGFAPHTITKIHAVAHVLELGVNAALADIEDVLYVNSVNQDTYNFFGISAKRRVAFELSKVEEECQLKWVGSHGIRYQESQHRMYEVAAVNFANTLAFFLKAGAAEAAGGSLLTLHSPPTQFLDRRFRTPLS